MLPYPTNGKTANTLVEGEFSSPERSSNKQNAKKLKFRVKNYQHRLESIKSKKEATKPQAQGAEVPGVAQRESRQQCAAPWHEPKTLKGQPGS